MRFPRTIAAILCCLMLTSSAFADTDKTIRLGATIPLTGDFISYGTLIKNGIELAANEARERGIKVETFYEDVPYPGPKAVSAIRKLIDQDKIHALAGNFLNPAIPAMAPAIMRNKIIAFHTAIADDLILNAGDYIVSTNAKIKDEAAKLADYAFNTLGARTASILYISTTFGDNYAEHFEKSFEKLGGEILMKDTTQIGDSDLRGVLTKVKTKKADVFFAAYFGTNMGTVLKQAFAIGIESPILGDYETEDKSVLEVAGAGAEGVRFFVPQASQAYAETTNFAKKYVDTYGVVPQILAKNSYDATNILIANLTECNLEPGCALKKIYSIEDYPGASGRISIDQEGAAKKDFVLKTIKDGSFIRID